MKNLSEQERYKIETYLNLGYSPYKISKIMNRHHTTIANEIKRGTVEVLDYQLRAKQVYFADTGQRVHNERKHNKGTALAIGNNIALANELEHLIIDFRISPYSALELCKSSSSFCVNICLSTLYNYIHKNNVFMNLCDKHLPRFKRTRKKKEKRTVALNNKNGRSIEMRSNSINNREIYGHWEIDSVVGKQGTKTSLITLVERVTNELLIFKVHSKSLACTCSVLDYLEYKYKDIFYQKFKSITADNGVEFINQDILECSVFNKNIKRTTMYYAHPYSSWERGTNENTNRMIRRYIPKSIDIDMFSEEYIQLVQDIINNLPRRKYNGLSSVQMVQALGIP